PTFRQALRSLDLVDRDDPLAELVARNRDRRDWCSRCDRDCQDRSKAAWPTVRPLSCGPLYVRHRGVRLMPALTITLLEPGVTLQTLGGLPDMLGANAPAPACEELGRRY